MDKTCNLCGVVIFADNEMCETCSLMMNGNNQPTENSSVSNKNPANQIETSQNYFPPENNPPQLEQPIQEPTNFAPSMMTVADNFQPEQSFTPTFAPPPPRPLPPQRSLQTEETKYKPSLWYWISELPAFVKIILVVLIFSVCFAVVIKGFMKMDVSVVSTNPDLEQQKPWFSAWFRSEPSGDEILEKYEKATFAQGKNLTAESFYITGKAEIIEPKAKGIKDLIKYKPNQNQNTANTNTNLAVKNPNNPNIQVPGKTLPNPSDFDIRFEVSIKKPNKFLMKMTTKPKGGYNQNYVSFPTMGFDGKKGWAFTKSYYNGNSEIAEEKAPSSNYFFKQTNDGVALTFLRSSYSTVEVTGQADVLNRLAYSVKAIDVNGKETTLFFDIETGLASKVVENNVEMYILDYTNFEGTMFPSKVVYITSAKGWLMLTMEQVKSNVPFEDSIFERSSYK